MRGLVIVALLASAANAAKEEEDPVADAERDALIEKIAGGTDYDASVKRLRELVLVRDKRIATSADALAKEKAKQDAERAARVERNRLRDEYRKTADSHVADRCTLSVDPLRPVRSPNQSYAADWGKITRREATRLPPKNELDEGEPITLYEVRGLAGTYQFDAARFGRERNPFDGKVGDFVVICLGSDHADKIPAGWGPRVYNHGFATRASGPPLIVKKTRWPALIEITENFMYWAITDVKWKLPDDAFVLIHVEVQSDLGEDHYEVMTNNNKSWILEVPATVKHRELLQPGHYAWVIGGQHRFDRALHKLVLVAEDIEERYVMEPK